MNWREISVKTRQEAVEAVSEAFRQAGSGGVVIEDPYLLREMAKSGKWDCYELPAELVNNTYSVVKGYLPANGELAGKMAALEAELAAVAARIGDEPYEITMLTVDEEDWANSWKVYFKPLKIGERIVIRPTWEPYQGRKDEIVIDMDPGMAFGTGTHITTAMCVRFLEQYVKDGDTVIDVGTGTGILAISAARLGAKRVLALDYDAMAVKVCHENVAKNSLDDLITVKRNDLLAGIEYKAQIITANIIADIIIRLFQQVETCLSPGGILITSGVISDRKDDVCRAAERSGLELIDESSGEGWVAQVWKMKEC